MHIKILTLNETEEWRHFLSLLPPDQQDIYFTPAYYGIYEKNGDGKAHCFVYSGDEGMVMYPFLKNEIKSEDFGIENGYCDIEGAYGYNGIITANNNSELADAFYRSFHQYCRDEKIVAEFTRFHPILQNQTLSANHMTVIRDRRTVCVDLGKSEEEIWNNDYNSANRNKIRKAQKMGMTVSITDGFHDTGSFCSIYHETMNNVNADSYYFFDNEYFSNLSKRLGSNCFLVSVHYGGRVIAMTIVMHYGEYAHYHLSGRIRDEINIHPHNVMLDAAIKHSKTMGCRYFHLGGGNTNDPENPLFKFKTNFSDWHPDFYIGKKIHDAATYEKIVKRWETKYPEKKELYKKFVLKYRF